MSDPIVDVPDEPSEQSISLLIRSLRSDCENKGVSSTNYAHRARVIRQQTELLHSRSQQVTQDTQSDSEGDNRLDWSALPQAKPIDQPE